MKTLILLFLLSMTVATNASLTFTTTCSTCLCTDSLDVPLINGDAGGTKVSTGAFCNDIKRNGNVCTIVTPPTTTSSCIAIYGGTTLRDALSYAQYMSIPIWGNETGSLAIMETHPHVTAGVLRLVLSMSSDDMKHQPKLGDIGGLSDIRDKITMLLSNSTQCHNENVHNRKSIIEVQKNVTVTRNHVTNVERNVNVVVNKVTHVEKTLDITRNIMTNEVNNLTNLVTYKLAPGSQTMNEAVTSGVTDMFINATVGVELILSSLDSVLDVGGNLSLNIARVFERSVLTTAQQKSKYFGEMAAIALSAILSGLLIVTNISHFLPSIRLLRSVFESRPCSKSELFVSMATCDKVVPLTMIEEDMVGCDSRGTTLDFDMPDQCYFVGLVCRLNHKIDTVTIASTTAIIRYGYATFGNTPFRSFQYFHLAIQQWRNLDFSIADGKIAQEGIHESTDDNTNKTAYRTIDNAINRGLNATMTRPTFKQAGTTFVRIGSNTFPMANTATVWPFGFIVYDKCGMIVRAYKFETNLGEALGTMPEKEYFDSSYSSSRAAIKIARNKQEKKPPVKQEIKGIQALKKAGDPGAAQTDGGLSFIA